MQNFYVCNTSPIIIIIITIYNDKIFQHDQTGFHCRFTKKGQLFEKDIELVLSGVENTKECMTHSPLEVSPISAGAKLEGGQIFQ